MSESEEGMTTVLILDPVVENADTLRCPACGTGVSYNDGICSACGQVYCPGCGHALDDEEDERCPFCGLALAFACPECDFAVAVGAKICPECGVLFVRRCPACDERILDAPQSCPACDHPFELTRRSSADIFAEMGLVLLKCPVCATKFGSELGACQICGQRVCPECYLLLGDDEMACPYCEFHAARSCPACGVDVGLGLVECSACGCSLCPACGALVGDKDAICPKCGTELPFYCPICGTKVEAEARVCPECYEPLEE